MKSRGFTLIELLVTLAIISVLATVTLPLAETTWQRTKEQELRRALREIRDAIDAYKQASDEGRIAKNALDSGYPKDLKLLFEGVEDAKSPEKKKIYFIRRIPRDPMHVDPNASAEETWGLRCYDSPPDDPRDGDDIFDVYSLSDRRGLNGVAYREW